MDRLQKFLAHAGIASRRAAERMIEEGRVTVNGSVVRTQGCRVDPARDSIKVDGKRVAAPRSGHIYLVLNKPRGYVTTMSDPEGRPTVADLIRKIRHGVVPVGRLDLNSEGLLLLTNDGDLARDLMHPSSGVPKSYSVKVRGEPTPATLGRLRGGVRVDGRVTRPTEIRIERRGGNAWLRVTVVEGRNHIVKRLLEAVGHPVVKLKRIRYGSLRLGRLPSGSIRPLTPAELSALRLESGSSRGRRRRPGST
jgi:23S rRNA pseudouridine2605 synthase